MCDLFCSFASIFSGIISFKYIYLYIFLDIICQKLISFLFFSFFFWQQPSSPWTNQRPLVDVNVGKYIGMINWSMNLRVSAL